MRNNAERSLEGLFTIEAWHAEFNAETKAVDLHVHVNFGTAKMGGEPESPVLFQLRLRRATIVAVIPEDSGFSVDPKSVDRTKPQKVSAETTTTQNTSVSGEVAAELSHNNFKPSAKGNAKGEKTKGTKLSTNEDIFAIRVIDGKFEGNNCWHLEPLIGRCLSGTPWAVNEAPRLKILDKRSKEKREQDQLANITDPTVVELRCRREDLEINLEPKILDWPGGRAKNMAAAESYIRDHLIGDALEVEGDLSETNKYARIQLAEIIAQISEDD